jgi:hypothetical protein
MPKHYGFFVKYDDKKYSKPYEFLNEARSDARMKGNDLKIYHGNLVIREDGTVDDSEIFLVPKLIKR